MKLSDKPEEILEVMGVELTEKDKQSCDRKLFKDDESINNLIKGDYIEVIGDKLRLTDKGAEEAISCVRRHRLAERLLNDILDVKKQLVHETSCTFEHLLHKGLDENICTILGHPKTCPHGRPIPEGRCCRESRQHAGKLVSALSDIDTGNECMIVYLQTHDKAAVNKLIAMGILPGITVLLLQKFPTLVLQIGRSQFAIDKKLASHIFVRIINKHTS